MVPNGWDFKELAEVCSKPISYGIVQTGPEVNEGIPCVRVVDLTKQKLKTSEMILTSQEIHQSYKKTILQKNELMMALRGEIGLIRIVTDNLVGINITRGIARLAPKINYIDPNYLLWAMRSSHVKNDLMRKAGGSALQEIALTALRKVKVPVPPLPEQRKIAKILSTWDKAISNTERLIDNSKQQKKALMQQLLTGKKRLLDDSGKPFEGEWEDLYLHEVAKIIVSPVDKKIIEGEIPVELCNYTDVYYNSRITKSLDFMKATAKQSEIDKYTLQVNDVIITKDSETPGDIAIPALVSEDLGGTVCGYHLAIIRPNSRIVEGAYLNYLFSMPKTRYYFFTLATGATRFGLSVGGINKAHFTLPPLEEQQKIASVLTSSDKEIELLEQQLADLKQEKKALMQQLLTGKRRVNLN